MSDVTQDRDLNTTGIAYGNPAATVRALAATGRFAGRLTFSTLLSRLADDRLRTCPTEAELIDRAHAEMLAAGRRSGGVRRRPQAPRHAA